jgi:hypothetical protein
MPSSLSDSANLLAEVKPLLRYVFTVVMWTILFPIMAVLFELTAGKWWQFMVFFLVAGIAFVSVTPSYKNVKIENTVHKTGAIAAIIGGLFYSWRMVHEFSLFVFLASFILFSVGWCVTGTAKDSKKYPLIYIVELATFITTYQATLQTMNNLY